MPESITALALALISIAIWEIGKAICLAVRDRNGLLAGDWYQVVYDPRDVHAIWSIEWVHAKHRRGNLRSKSWRICNRNFDRRWELIGRYEDGFALCHYWATRGSGKDGAIILNRRNRDAFIGMLVKAEPENARFSIDHDGFIAHVQWLRVDKASEPAVLEIVNSVPRDQLREHLPRRIHRKLTSRLDKVIARTGPHLSYESAVAELTVPIQNAIAEADER
ncbi:hypothetical protein [Streptomyces sp. NPDC056723]|uniref:hypothetical protein n=1 Tax=Streptomyces sp. NPDC056723 TaxID=3345925 RepID=UPI00367EE712